MSRSLLPERWNRPGSKLLFVAGSRGESAPDAAPRVTAEALRGRVTELSGESPAALLTLATRWVSEVQRSGETAAWLTTPQGLLYPPDLAEGGVDLERLLVVRVPDPPAVARAAEFLLRSGGIGLVVLDFLDRPPEDRTWLNRLLVLALGHQACAVCLTGKPADEPSLGSLVGLRIEASLQRKAEGGFVLSAEVLKDKRGQPYRRFAEVYRGPMGLR